MLRRVRYGPRHRRALRQMECFVNLEFVEPGLEAVTSVGSAGCNPCDHEYNSRASPGQGRGPHLSLNLNKWNEQGDIHGRTVHCLLCSEEKTPVSGRRTSISAYFEPSQCAFDSSVSILVSRDMRQSMQIAVPVSGSNVYLLSSQRASQGFSGELVRISLVAVGLPDRGAQITSFRE